MKQWKDELSIGDDDDESNGNDDTSPSDTDHTVVDNKNTRTSESRKVC